MVSIMGFAIFVSLAVGICSVLQSVFNKNLVPQWGLAPTVFLTCAIMLVGSLMFWGFQSFFSASSNSENFSWSLIRGKNLFLILASGILGGAILYGYPFAMGYLGATRVVVLAVTAQCLTGLIWDWASEGTAPGLIRIVGVLVAIIGATLAQMR